MDKMDPFVNKICFILLVTLCKCPSSADLISNVKTAIISNIGARYGADKTITNTEFQQFLEDVVPFKKDENSECDEAMMTEACAGTEDNTRCREFIAEKCKDSPFPWDLYMEPGNSVPLNMTFPALVFQLQNSSRDGQINDERVHKTYRKTSQGAVWGYGIGFSVLLALISMEGSCMVPCMKRRFFKRILMYCVGLGVGTMACAGTLVLIPEALSLTGEDSPAPNYHFKMATFLGGLYIFYTCSRLKKMWQTRRKVKSQGGPVTHLGTIPGLDAEIEFDVDEDGQDMRLFRSEDSPSAEPITDIKPKKREVATVAWILLFGDAFHKFIDGVSVGAAFTESLFAGISVALAVICEEIPHELGDIALLLNAGMSARKALLYNELVCIPSFVGVTMGIVLGENTDASTWILAVAGGIFIYISFVDMLPEMNEQATKAIEEGTEGPCTILFLQNLGLITGFVVIFLLAHFGGEIGHLLG